MQKVLKVIMILLFVSGLGLVGYSVYQITDGANKVQEKTAEAKDLINEAGYNSKGQPKDVDWSKIDVDSLSFDKGETMGILYVPKLDKEIPIVEGTDPDELELGVGHYTGTALPLQKDQIVLSGHRDTVFRNFDQLKIGDSFVVQLPYGSFEYKIYETEIVSADDTTVIRSTAPDEILTVTTCYPFYFLGNAPDRFIFYAKPVYEN
ncbi:class D sortase [Caldibacillus lycopersici]|uniref:Class D sortase n=1 Tax=Perspicuibacillus lycopersici TaxID=1325689 RepID=A0AAE3LQ35_9BACI|nr:class D sortase [Perspicuibacillus lycopersici]MCU9612999.1 class D sortase [Perspicuibacillus lycopersici]